jgi:tetratricopeptide (TPR) repeat protein
MTKTQQKSGIIERGAARWHDILLYLLLLSATLAVYSQVRSFEFVNYDDREYVSANARVRAGLNAESLAWALTTSYGGNWFPLTWMSHMLDCQLSGLDSGLHHLTSVLIHGLSTLLLFAALKRMTGSRWSSAFVAFLFALHPLHVESVAWVTERKDVLSAFFWFLTIWGYARYVERPRLSRYLFVLVSFCLGLMSKSMVVTLPFVLLLLDLWPLRRISFESAEVPKGSRLKAKPGEKAKAKVGTILLEKVPLFVLSAIISIITFIVQRGSGAVVPLDLVPLGTRLSNGLISYILYIYNILWPAGLSAFYPPPPALPAWQILGAGLALAALSVVAFLRFRRYPYLAIGWFWFLGTLVPVIGFVQVGMQARADRYTYLPSVGILLLVSWGVADLMKRWPRAKPVLAGLLAASCLACAILTWTQTHYWRDSMSLFQHALEVTTDNHVAHNGVGIALQEQGRIEEAIAHFQEAIKLRPRYPEAHANLGDALLRLGRIEEAVPQLNEAIRLHPGSLEARIDLGVAYNAQGKVEESISLLLEALKIQPDSADAHYNLGRVYAGAGRMAEAAARFSLAARLQPDNAEALYNLGITLASQGNMRDAAAAFDRALIINPNYAAAHNNLGGILANMGQIDESIAHFREALRLRPDSQEIRHNLEYALSLKK